MFRFLNSIAFCWGTLKLRGVYFTAISAAAISISACAKKDETFLTIQLCVNDSMGVKHLKELMQNAAKAENLQFVDGSLETGKSLEIIGANGTLNRDPSLAINVGIKSESNTYVMGGNLGLPPYQVALGFGVGADPDKGKRLSERLIRLLSNEWRVETVPQGKGVFPINGCGGSKKSEVVVER